MGAVFFPLDEVLGLLPGRYTPRLQEGGTRLGAKLPFKEAAEEVAAWSGTMIGVSTVRRWTEGYGEVGEALARQEAEELFGGVTKSEPDAPAQMMMSSDGAFVALTNGEWREVKTVVIGTYGPEWVEKQKKVVVRTDRLSYFSRSYGAREFETYALAELHRRGVGQAKRVVAVNDGAAWIQSFVDYHRPDAVRIIDFAHALGYVATLGQTALGAESAAFQTWFSRARHQLRHQPPQRNLHEWAWLRRRLANSDQEAAFEAALRYLTRRQKMIDYPHFERHGFPIGSGAVESSHKHVVQRRLKQAGMRWAERNLNPMLALRNLIANGRWSTEWPRIVAYQRQQRRQRMALQPVAPTPAWPPISLAKVQVAPETQTAPHTAAESWRPASDHPWRAKFVNRPSRWTIYRQSQNS